MNVFICIGNNPVNAKEGFKYHILLKLNLDTLEDDKLTELDKDLAKIYYKQNGLQLPEVKKPVVVKGKEARVIG